MSGLEGNPSATSSGVAGSATTSSIEAGSAASSAPGSDGPVDGRQPVVLQPSSLSVDLALRMSRMAM